MGRAHIVVHLLVQVQTADLRTCVSSVSKCAATELSRAHTGQLQTAGTTVV